MYAWKRQQTLWVGLLLSILATMPWLSAAAQADDTIAGPDLPVRASIAEAPAVDVIPPLGQPGLSFRYVQTFGEAETAYQEDNNHFYNVVGLGVDGDTLWATDSWGDRVLKFDANGNFLQKIGKAGFEYATGTSLDYLSDVAVDNIGNIWVVDGSADHVAKFDANGNLVSELGQAWNRGADNGHFNDPIGIVFDSAGNVYVSDSGLWGDSGNHRVQVFDNNGTYLTTIGQTGNPGPGNNQFRRPRRMAIYGNRLFVADAGNHRVQVFDISTPTAPTFVATLGVTENAGSDNGHFDFPEGVGVDANYLYVADSNNHRVQVFNRNTLVYVATIGAGTRGQDNAHFDHPTDVVVDASGRIYVADAWNKRVQQYDSSRNYRRTYGTAGDSYVTDGYHYNRPKGVAVGNDGGIHIIEERGHRLVKLNAAGIPQWTVGEPGQNGGDNSHFFGPQDVAVDGSGRVYGVEGWGNHRVQIFNSDGSHNATLGAGEGNGNYEFRNPDGIALDTIGNIYVADTSNHRVQIYDIQKTYVATLGATGVSGSDNSHFSVPRDVAVDKNGVIYVADEGNDRVQVFNSNRQYVRTIGQTGDQGSDFGHFDGWGPNRLAVDAQNRLYVADTGNNRIQIFDSSGAYLATIGDSWGSRAGQFRGLQGLAIGPDGAVYVADVDNHRIQKFVSGTPNWIQRNINGFGTPNQRQGALTSFGGKLFASTSPQSGGAKLWRFDSQWTQVADTGLGDPTNLSIIPFFEFGGQLYAGTDNLDETTDRSTGAQLLRSVDGVAWNPVMTGGFGRTDNGGIFAIGEFSGTLYAGTYSFTDTHGAELWRSATGNAGDWQQVVPDGFGDVNNRAIWSLATHNGQFYASTANFQTGTEVWRSATGQTWEKVAPAGFGYPSLALVFALESFNGYLFAGAYSDPNVSTSIPTLWRCQVCDSSDWQVVAPAGFGNLANFAVESLVVYERALYAFTGNYTTGMEVWRSTDGAAWGQVGFAGLGDVNNIYPLYDNSTTVHNGNLYLGVWNNATGSKIWQYLPERAAIDISDPALAYTLIFTPTTGGNSTVQIPADTLDQPTDLVYEPFIPSTRPPDFAFAGRAFELNAFRSGALAQNLQFLQPVIVVIDYTDTDVAGLDENTLVLQRWNTSTAVWEDAACGAYIRQPAAEQDQRPRVSSESVWVVWPHGVHLSTGRTPLAPRSAEVPYAREVRTPNCQFTGGNLYA